MSREFDPTNPDDYIKRALPHVRDFSFLSGLGSVLDITGSMFKPPKLMTAEEAFKHDAAQLKQDGIDAFGEDMLKGDK
jgi:hypothetical protein